MRVLLVTPSYAPVVGGLQTVVARLAGELRRAGHCVLVLTSRYPRTLPAAEELDGVALRRVLAVYPDPAQLRAGRADLWFYGLCSRRRVYAQLQQIVADFRPEVIHAHFADGLCAWLPEVELQRRASIRHLPSSIRHPSSSILVVTLHGDDIDGLARRSPTARKRNLRLLAAADALTAPSAYLLEQALELLPTARPHAAVIPNGVPTEELRGVQPYAWQRPYLLGLGRLVPSKGFDLLLDAFAGLPDTCDLLIAGDGPERRALEAQLARAGLVGRAWLLGAVDRPMAATLLAGAQLLVIPSRQEAFGLVALEAWAAGVPIVASDAGGLPEALAGSGARFAAAGSAASLRAVIEAALSAPPVIVPPLPARYGWGAIARGYVTLYHPLGEKRGARGVPPS